MVKEKYADFYGKMFDFRQEVDYGDFVEFEKDKVKCWLDEAEEFVDEIEKIISKIIEERK